MTDEYQDLETVEKDGAPVEVSDDVLHSLKEIVNDLRAECSQYVQERRQNAEEVRYCHWEGQSADGRKHKEALGADALPFEGASDNRVRLADKLVRIFERQVVAAATRSEASVSGTEINDAHFAGKLKTLLRYVIKNVWGQNYRRQMKLSANYMYADSPGAAIAFVDWSFEEGLEYRTITAEEALMQIVENASQQALDMQEPGVLEEIIAQANVLFIDESRRSDLAAAMSVVLPEVQPTRLRAVAKDLQKTGEAKYPARYVKKNEPVFRALRLYEDVFIPTNTMDIQRARAIPLREWYTKAEILERAAVEGWSKTFVNKLLYGSAEATDGCGQEGMSAFDDYIVPGPTRDYNQVDNRKGLFEILRVYTRAANEDGVIGIYVYTISHFVDEAAKERELWDRQHGKYPFVFGAAETLTGRLIDSRGVPEVTQTEQKSMKLLRDSFEDHTQVVLNPPIVKPRGRPFFNVNRAPFGQIEADARDNIKLLDQGQYPSAADKYNRDIRREINEYWGILDAETMPNEWMAVLFSQDRVDDFLAYLSEVHAMTIQLCQQYMSDETIQRITGGSGVAIARSVEEIQGRFDYQLSFDVQNLDLEKIVSKAEVVLKNIRPLDTKGEIPYAPFLRSIVAAIDPNWAELIPPSEVSEMRIVTEEQNNVVMMLNGIEPPMPETIEAPGLRLQVIEQTLAPRLQQPAAFPPMSPASQMIIQNRMKYLQFQNQQMANAETGRVGTEPVSPQQIAQAVPQ